MQDTLTFPQSLTEKYRPHLLAEFAGLDKQKRILSKFAARPYPSAWLFVGPPGVGKTVMALAMAEEMKAELHHIPSRECDLAAVQDVCRRCWYVPLGGGFHVVLIDEADRMTEPAQLAFLSKLDSTAFPPNTIFVFTANGTDNLEPRFLSRCRVIEFGTYGLAQPATDLLRTIWNTEVGDSESAPDFSRIVKQSANNIREALMNLELKIMEA